MITADSWDRAGRHLAQTRRVVLACHVSPDGDALGSMLGLGLYLTQLGKKVWMTWGATEVVKPVAFGFLPGIDGICGPDQVPEAPETFVALDCGHVSRLDVLTPKFEAAQTTVNIDHHVSNNDYADINLVDPAAASSSELVYELIKRMGGELDSDVATCLYTGIVTDTGRFQYSNTTAGTLRAAADLISAGADHVAVGESVYESAPFAQLGVLGAMFNRARLIDGVVYSWVELADLGELSMEDTDDLIDALRSVREAEVALLLKERPEGGWKGSLRARSDVDVSEIARSLGGGGHVKAAGFVQQGDPEEVVKRILDKLTAAAGASA
ncbi:MAG: bifunctional oligoribonuclease/PAP phosphatase NrnA [Actinomycetota bacterium]